MPGVLAASKAQPGIDEPVDITGTGFTAAGVVNLTIRQEGVDGMQVNYNVTAVAGAITGPTIIPGAPGHIDITAHDVTANTDTSLQIQVFD